MQPPWAVARDLWQASRRAVAFTGAGISTASGVPDFRSPGGVWSRFQPVALPEFLASQDARRRYWAYKREMFAAVAAARPNIAHEVLARQEDEGRIAGVITQNIDGLHQLAGSRTVFELHGTNRIVRCLECRDEQPAERVQVLLESGVEVPTCEKCGGFLKPATISFGQTLDPGVLEGAYALAESADLLLVLGSSLLVHPAADVPHAAAAGGGALVIVNREPTPLDGLARAVLNEPVESVLPALVAE